MYKKQQQLMQSGATSSTAVALKPPFHPLSGWVDLTESCIGNIGPKIPVVTQGIYNVLCMCISGLTSLYIIMFYIHIIMSYIHILYFIGTLYTYLACSVDSKPQEVFRALSHGYNHWVCGRIDEIQVHTAHPQYCHIRARATPSMKPGMCHVYFLLLKEDNFLTLRLQLVNVLQCKYTLRFFWIVIDVFST